jgi:uncharacterized membrane protein (UPF0127 family)
MFFKNFKFKVLFILLILILFFSILFYFKFKKIHYENTKIIINNKEFFVEIADNNLKRKKGLGDRKFICENCGMLFIFPEKSQYSFWMKNMNFDLDILWLEDEKVVFIEKNVSYKNQKITYKSEIISNSVLELKAGNVDKFEIKIGDELEFLKLN